MAFFTVSNQIAGYVVLASDYNIFANNDNAINSFFRQELWPDKEAHAPASGIVAAGISVVESSDGGTNKPLIPIVGYSAAVIEGRQWACRWPRGYGVSAALVGSYYMTGANTDDEAVLQAYMAAVSDGDASMTAKAFDAANALIHTVPDAIATADAFSIPFTNDDGVAANDWVNILLLRNGPNGSDTANNGELALTSLAVDFDLAT